MRLLIVDDEPAIARAVALALRGTDCAIEHVGEPAAILSLAQRTDLDRHDAILLDVNLDQLSGLDVLAQLREAGCPTAIVMLTGDTTSATATAALHGGAFHYLTKPIVAPRLIEVVTLAAHQSRLVRALARPDPAVDVSRALVGSTPTMARLRGQIRQFAGADVSVLIFGESGTGKEVVARALHGASPRHRQPFVALNCGAIASELIDSELFGHTRGAFTGAVSARAGVFAEADGGTLFLDEIGDMPMAVQTRLLRALQEGEVRAVGGEGARKVDVRVLAATHVDLVQAVEHGRFRRDLYFRLNVVSVQVPPLRDRRADVPELIVALLLRHTSTPPAIAISALDALTSYAWPGNVRELDNALRHALAMCNGGVIDLAALPAAIAASTRQPQLAQGSGVIASIIDVPLTEAKRRAAADFERDYLVRILEQAKGSTTAAARAAGMDRTNFRRLLQRHELDADSFKPSGEPA